jgi:DNA sulfur modification protein DndD
MKLLSARFHNFRLLRDLTIDFSVDAHKKLSVIRAENETGKTTMLAALQWALYGDDALPNKGEGYRIHPIDWDIKRSAQVPISAQIEFEITAPIPGPSGATRQTRKRYRLLRSATETISGAGWRRSRSTPQLFLMGENGDTPLAEPEAIIVDYLPPELREVFFTDGDRALSFIEAGLSTTTKRDRVQRAIRALLGLSVIESAERHVKDASSDINRKARAMTASADLQKLTDEVEETEKAIADLEEDLKASKEQFEHLDEQLNHIDKRIGAALQKGDQEALAKELEGCKRRIRELDTQLDALDKAHSSLFKSASLARDLLRPTLESAMAIMDGLRQQGKIPNTTIPVLYERLEIGTCICGGTLDEKDPDGARRRKYIEGLIEQNRKEDELQKLLTEFYFRSKSFVYDQSRESMPWVQLYSEYFAQRTAVEKQRESEGGRMRAIEARIAALGNTDIAELRQNQGLYRQQRDDANRKVAVLQNQLANRRQHLESLTKRRDALLKEESKGQLIAGQLNAVQDVLLVLQRSYERICNEELKKVSDCMNAMFLRMIGADPEQNAIIRKAEISPDYDILVYGAEGRHLNPDQDLNGASRRALTLSFILALTKVSECEAPNIIDTPLGMMAGYVKREVLRTAIQESSQLILFLTSSEIRDCEDILDQYAGCIVTLTNPAHYPRMLVNPPPSPLVQILRCDCNHRQSCRICERRLDAVIADAATEAAYV